VKLTCKKIKLLMAGIVYAATNVFYFCQIYRFGRIGKARKYPRTLIDVKGMLGRTRYFN
jgi:hypothetical protein